MFVNEPELVDGVILVPDAAAAVVAARLKVPVEANASESVTCMPETVIDPSGFRTVVRLLVKMVGAAWFQ
jgi:hypothetical protein